MRRNSILFLVGFFSVLMGGCQGEEYSIELEPSGTKVMKGHIVREDLEAEPTFLWFNMNYKMYTPDSATVVRLKPLMEDIHFFVIVGTWCSDSKREIPRLWKLCDALGIPEKNITMYAVDRAKRSEDGSTEKFNIYRIPTIIVFKNHREMGRIVEQPRTTIEADLLNILQP
ncbi:MAG: thioredoxin family protein [Bacteroidota bacterium]